MARRRNPYIWWGDNDLIFIDLEAQIFDTAGNLIKTIISDMDSLDVYDNPDIAVEEFLENAKSFFVPGGSVKITYRDRRPRRNPMHFYHASPVPLEIGLILRPKMKRGETYGCAGRAYEIFLDRHRPVDKLARHLSVYMADRIEEVFSGF